MKNLKEKMKNRLDAFSDAIIAIIITIMILDLPIEKLTGGAVDYVSLFRAIGIYAVSFVFIGNLWYQHAEIFNEVDEVSNLTVITDLILIFFMSLIPTFTNLMTNDTSQNAVLMYGILILIIWIIYKILVAEIVDTKYKDNSKMHEIYYLIHGKNINASIVSSIILIVLSIFVPKVAVAFFLLVPIWSFLQNIREHDDFTEVAEGADKVHHEPIYKKDLTKDQKMELKQKIAETLKSSKKMTKEQKKKAWIEFGAWAIKEDSNK